MRVEQKERDSSRVLPALERGSSLAPLGKQALFLVWGPPSHGPRSQVLARELGIDELHFVYATTKRGLLSAPFKYACQAVQTLQLLFHKRPKIVFVQSPPSLAVLFVFLYCAITDSRYLIDAHSAALQLSYWTRPRWLHRRLLSRAVVTIVTNEHFRKMIQNWGASGFVLRDIPTTFPRIGSFALNGGFNVGVVNTFADDEPLEQVLEAAKELEGVNFYVTGPLRTARQELLAKAPGNVHFTDFLSPESYYALLASCDAIACFTTRNFTMQRGACEALSLAKPIITSDWPLLREYFHKGAVHVSNTSAGIRQGILALREHHRQYQEEVLDLREERRREWQQKRQLLASLVQSALRAE